MFQKLFIGFITLVISSAVFAQGDIDYNDLGNWAAHPDKDDLADGVPDSTLSNNQNTAEADVFFVHPTTYTKKFIEDSWNGPVDNADLNEKTDNGTIKHQASIFNAAGRVFAPRYRQAHLKAFYPKKSKGKSKQAFDIAYSDIIAAFEVFLEQKGDRPFIIAAHSQGTLHANRLVKEYIDGQPLAEKLIAAYLVGMPVKKSDFEAIPICDDPDQTNCYVSWRSYKKGARPKGDWGKGNDIAVVNPITWTTQNKPSEMEEHKGIVLGKFNKIYPKKTKAQVANNVLWVKKPRFPGSFLIMTK
ncbi:MAG: DUF3089 domain-containing protein, partial [Croceitalea sp.]|nr:DUF3089 domain-containing protein [Croceitalea sp.]